MDKSILPPYIISGVSNIQEVYTRLPLKTNEFRLLWLRSKSNTGIVDCELGRVDMNYAGPPYVAVSYTWGGQSLNHTVLCNGIEVPVTRSCADVLSAILTVGRGVVWIDQLCIDQKNDEEKADQILLMKDIYANAGAVASWLDKIENLTCGLEYEAEEGKGVPSNEQPEYENGESSTTGSDPGRVKEIEETMQLVKYLGDYWRCRMLLHRRGEPASLDDMPTSLCAWDHVLAMFSHPYFERRFIIQEIAVPQKHASVLLDGKHPLHWDHVEGCAQVLAIIKARLAPEFYTAIPKSALSQLYYSCSSIGCIAKSTSIRDTRINGGSMTLLELLQDCKTFQETDERDRVFAFYGLASDGNLPKPDYNIPMTKLLPSIARYYIIQGKGLDVLSNAGLASRASETAIPSWVPTWKPGSTAPFRHATVKGEEDPERSGLAAAGLTSLNIKIVDDGSILLVHGSVIDRIRATTQTFQWKQGPDFVVHARNFVPPNRRTTSKEFNDRILPFATPAEFRNRFDRSIGERLDLTLMTMFLSDEIIKNPSTGAEVSAATTNAFSDLASDALMAGRRICLTEQGHVGLVPSIAEPGDWVAIFDGMNVATIVRYVREGKGPSKAMYQMIGDSYLLGLGRGEALELDNYKRWRIVFELI